MTIQEFPLLSKSEVNCPPAGYYSIFRDKDNGGLLTAKDSNCSFTIISVSYVSSEAVASLTGVVNKIIDDAGCALTKGMITADQYESIVDNFNMCFVTDVDPVTGSSQTCIQNEETLFISLVLTHVLCNGGSTGTATPTVSGGEAPYTITWGGDNPAALFAGAHAVTVVDNNGKTKSVGFIITEPPILSAISSSTPDTGGGNGTATVVASGGTPPYTYLWDDGGAQTTATATGLTAGNYNCTITDDNGCVLVVGPVVVA